MRTASPTLATRNQPGGGAGPRPGLDGGRPAASAGRRFGSGRLSTPPLLPTRATATAAHTDGPSTDARPDRGERSARSGRVRRSREAGSGDHSSSSPRAWFRASAHPARTGGTAGAGARCAGSRGPGGSCCPSPSSRTRGPRASCRSAGRARFPSEGDPLPAHDGAGAEDRRPEDQAEHQADPTGRTFAPTIGVGPLGAGRPRQAIRRGRRREATPGGRGHHRSTQAGQMGARLVRQPDQASKVGTSRPVTLRPHGTSGRALGVEQHSFGCRPRVPARPGS